MYFIAALVLALALWIPALAGWVGPVAVLAHPLAPLLGGLGGGFVAAIAFAGSVTLVLCAVLLAVHGLVRDADGHEAFSAGEVLSAPSTLRGNLLPVLVAVASPVALLVRLALVHYGVLHLDGNTRALLSVGSIPGEICALVLLLVLTAAHAINPHRPAVVSPGDLSHLGRKLAALGRTSPGNPVPNGRAPARDPRSAQPQPAALPPGGPALAPPPATAGPRTQEAS